ncbi:MAG: hypothetical protein WDO14_25345 [Bacteroidota bacterium]
MQNTEKQKFEENWKKAFDGAEATPPDRVWSSIEVDLAGQESAVMKRKVVFYQRLAAAMLLFALLAGTYAFYSSSEKSATSNVQRATNEVSTPKPEQQDNGSQSTIQKDNPILPPIQKQQVMTQQVALAEKTEEPETSETPVLNNDNIIASNRPEENTGLTKEEEKKITAVVSPLLQQQEAETPETVVEPKRKKKTKESLWLAFGGSAGNYTPNTPTATNPTVTQSSFSSKGPQLNFLSTSAPKAQPKVGSSYSVGVGVGKKFGRFVVQAGVNLNKQQINYTSNYDAHTSSNTSKAAMSDYIAQSNNLSVTSEYTVSSTMDIVSIPVQVGYMIVDRRFGWQINSGVSNDFFLRNVLVDKSGQREKSIEESGSASPYRAVNWSALASTEFSYRIGPHYRLSLVPGARYSFNSILKNATDAGRPVVLDVGFRFRYIFD